MLKALLRKQFAELFASLTVNRKNGKHRSKGGVIGFAVLFLFCFVSIGFAFVGTSFLMIDALLPLGLDWLYFTLAMISALCLGVFGSIFTTYSALYKAKDNELLLSMPIPAWKILFARTLTVGLSALLFTGLSWLPAVLVYVLQTGAGIRVILCGLAMLFILAAAVIVISCLLGWVVALIASRMKNKGPAITVLSLLAFGLYYYVCFNLSDLLTGILAKGNLLAESIQKDLWLLYEGGQAALGDLSALLICFAVAFVALMLTVFVLKTTFYAVVTMKISGKKKVYRETRTTAASADRALLRKEFNRLLSSPAYMMNCSLGTLFIPALAVILVLKAGDVKNMMAMLDQTGLPLNAWLPCFCAAILGMAISMNDLTAPSISLEAKNLWILRSMPVDPVKVLDAKRQMHLLLTVPVSMVTAVVVGIVLGFTFVQTLLLVLYVMVFGGFCAAFGLVMNLKFPNMHWVNETAAVKQGAAVMLGLFGGWALVILLGGLGYLVSGFMDPTLYLSLVVVILAILTVGLNLWLRKKGAEMLQTIAE